MCCSFTCKNTSYLQVALHITSCWIHRQMIYGKLLLLTQLRGPIKDQRACKATNAKQRLSPHPDTPKTQEVRRHQRSVTPQADDVMEGFLPHTQEQKQASKSSSSSETLNNQTVVICSRLFPHSRTRMLKWHHSGVSVFQKNNSIFLLDAHSMIQVRKS